MLLTLACGSCNQTPVDPVVDAPSSEPLGVLVVAHFQPSIWAGESVWVHGVFSRDTAWTEPVDPIGYAAQWLDQVYLPVGTTLMPQVGETLSGADVPAWLPGELETLDAGERVFVGDWVAYGEAGDGGWLYGSDPHEDELLETQGQAAVWVEGGADVDTQDATSGVVLAEPLELVDPPVSVRVERPDDDLVVAWTPSGQDGATVLVEVVGIQGLVTRVDDADGSVSFAAAAVQELGGDFLDVAVTRMVESTVQLQEGVVQGRSFSRQELLLVQVESLGFDPYDAISGERTVIEIYDPDGRLATTDFVDLGDGVIVESLTVQEDGLVLVAELLVSDDVQTGERDLSVVLEDGTVLTAGASFILRHRLPANDDCASAMVGPAVEDLQLYYRDNQGLTNTTDVIDCAGAEDLFEGIDSWHRIVAKEGDLVTASGFSANGDLMLSVYDACGGTLLACEDTGTQNEFEFLEFRVPEDGTYILHIDDYYDTPVDQVYLALDIVSGVGIQLWDNYVIQGETTDVELESLGWEFVQDDVSFDFGEGITVLSVDVPGGTGDRAFVTVSGDPEGTLGPRTVVATQGADTWQSREDGFDLVGWLPLSDDCGTADAIGALESVRWFGDLDGATDTPTVDMAACLGWAQPSFQDVAYAVDLPSEGASVTAVVTSEFDAGVALIRSCDGVPITCVDDGSVEESEILEFTAGAGEAGTYYLFVDVLSEEGGTGYQIDLRVSE